MDGKSIFNMSICILGIAIFLIHSADLFLKRDKRKDELNLLVFFLFTAVHFASYLSFVLLKANYSSNAFILGFYTSFYVMNNVEALLFAVYALSYIAPKKKIKDPILIGNLVVFGVFVLLDFLNLPLKFFFSAENGQYVRAGTMIFSQGYQMIAFAIVFFLAVFDKKLKRTERIAFSLYCVLPLAAIVLQNILAGYAIAYLSIIISIEILFLFANMRKNAALIEESRKIREAEVRIMMSQIQPHFIYNALSSISTLIQTDPNKAQMALDAFTDYLRMNLSSLTDTHLIPFSEELRHIRTYLSLEKMRFDDRLSLIYEIDESDFLVPPLSIQPLVENAVKHGILQKIEGGTMILRTYSKDNFIIVEIIDDGIGFDMNSKAEGDSGHYGLENVRFRLSAMCQAELDIQSIVGKGTTITIKFLKEGKA